MGLKRDTTKRLTLSFSLPTGGHGPGALASRWYFCFIPELQVKIAFE